MPRLFATLFAAVLLLAPATTLADEPAATSEDDPIVSGALESGGSLRILAWTGFLPGAGNDLERTLESSGFGASVSCFLFCNGSVDYPITLSDAWPWGLEIGYAIRSQLTLSAVAASTSLGRTRGYSDRGRRLGFRRQARTFAAIAAWTPTRRIRIGAGPALHSLRFDADDGAPEARASKAKRLGLLVDGTLDVVQTKTFLLSVKAQYRYIGSIHVGPFASSDWYGTPATLAPINVSFNHFFVGVAAGFRF